MTATHDTPAADPERVVVQRDYLLGVLVDREVAARVARFVSDHGGKPGWGLREAWATEARQRIAAAVEVADPGDYFVQLAREEM